jgi:drug/metabolite transporter (DMT)-like permease
MTRQQTFAYTLLAMLAFAGNSLLCRIALRHTGIDAASFTAVRLLSGALSLALILRLRGGGHRPAGQWISALALFTYAAAFSFAYLGLTAATGALLLFGAVQACMIGVGWWRGERLRRLQVLGFVLAVAGLVGLLLPGLSAPPWQGSGLMVLAGLAWAVYTLRGRGQGDALGVTAGNFARAVVPAAMLSLLTLPWASLDLAGVAYAVASGAVASGMGYAIWYRALPALNVTTAATVQLSVPALAMLGGIVFLAEPLTPRLFIASVVILGGIALVVLGRRT